MLLTRHELKHTTLNDVLCICCDIESKVRGICRNFRFGKFNTQILTSLQRYFYTKE